MSKVYIIDAARTAIGSFLGSLQTKPAHELGAHLIKELVKKTKIDTDNISEVILGQVLTSGQGQNPARQASINAGLPKTVPAFLVNQVCGSGLRSIIIGAQSIFQQNANLIIAGGQESMSLACHAAKIRGNKIGNIELVDTIMLDGLTDAFKQYQMGVTAENLANKYKISREEQDIFAYESQKKAASAQKSKEFKNEIIPIEIKTKKETIVFDTDEFVKPETTVEKLSKLNPSFQKDGTVTAGNSSGINDGAAIVLLSNEEMVKKYSWQPMAELISCGISGVDPSIMGIGPVDAVNKALARANWTLNDLDIIEANEAFAAQAIAVNKSLRWNVDIVNMNGGAIALGHPIGASGARILVTLLHQMKKNKLKKGIATLCVGGGMGVALCVKNIN